MKTTHYIGIDPGHSGAIGCLNAAGTTAESWPMPVKERKGVKQMDLDGLYTILHKLEKLPSALVGLEWPNTYAGSFGDVVRHAEVFGRGKGTLDAFLFLMGFDYRHVPPNQWKAKLGLPGKTWDKNSTQGQALWLREYPRHAACVLGPRGGVQDGPLDALLIAHYLRIGGESPCGHKGGRRPPVFRGMSGGNPLQDWWNNLEVKPEKT